MKEYCTQNNGDCSTCSLVNYGRDCMNNPVDKPVYQVDEYMMGTEWNGSADDLRRFCELLQRRIDTVTIEAVTDSGNGADNSQHDFDVTSDVDCVWNDAIDQHCAENPNAWRS